MVVDEKDGRSASADETVNKTYKWVRFRRGTPGVTHEGKDHWAQPSPIDGVWRTYCGQIFTQGIQFVWGLSGNDVIHDLSNNVQISDRPSKPCPQCLDFAPTLMPEDFHLIHVRL